MRLTRRQKYWLYGALSWGLIAIVVLLFGEQSWWKYAVLGITFAFYHELQKQQEEL